MWRMGMYVMSAVTVAVDHSLNGKKATSEYIKEPLLSEFDTSLNNSNGELTEEEADKIRQEFLARRKLAKTNWDLMQQ